MIRILMLLIVITLAGCDAPTPMVDAEYTAYNNCLKKGWAPKFFANTSIRKIDCIPQNRVQTAINE